VKRDLIILFSALCFLLIIALLPLPIPPYLDFQVIYHADIGLLRGISIYDHTGQVDMIARIAGVPPDQVFVLPFPYPPWYALVILPLALLPITVAARLWFGLNLLMLFAAIWLMTDGWEPRKRLTSFVTALFYFPILGCLYTGQYTFPVLLGAALAGYALKNQKVGLTALAAGLLTFKPHLGGLVLLMSMLYLILNRNMFGRRALIAIVITGIILFAIGLLASPLWPLDYFHSLTGFKNIKDVSQCYICNSISMDLASLFGQGLNLAVWFAVGLFILLIVWLWSQRAALAKRPDLLVAASVIITILVSPYLLNYDYILLLVPLFIISSQAHHVQWLFIALALLLPLVGLGFFGLAANSSLVASALIIFFLLAYMLPRLDDSPGSAYNPITTK
jgi:alpha-1,2-mannosyltransferase